LRDVAEADAMANQGRSFEAGGETYAIRFTQNALYKLEKELGRPLNTMVLGIGPVVLQTMMWAGLEGARMKNEPRRKPFTVEQAGDIIDELGGLPKATPIILDAWQAGAAKVADKKETDEGGGNAPANPTPS
jgi:hypothetical protein